MSNTYLVTGAMGCIGAWVVKQLAERGDTPVVFDIGGDPRRIKDVLDEATLLSAPLTPSSGVLDVWPTWSQQRGPSPLRSGT